MAGGEVYRTLGEQALTWVLAQVRSERDGPWLPATAGTDDAAGSTEPDEFWDGIYDGIGGLALLLTEVRLTRAWTVVEEGLAAEIAGRLTDAGLQRDDATLYTGLAGDVAVLAHLAPGRETATLRRLTDLAGPDGWLSTQGEWAGTPITDVVMGNAGIVLAGAWQGSPVGLDVTRIGAEALLRSANRTEAGLDWLMSASTRRPMPNFSHGTAGVVAALAMAGLALGDERYLDAAVQGAEHLLAVGDRTGGGFRLPPCVPWLPKDGEEYTYSWCHGPTGTAYAFAALDRARVGRLDGIPPEQWRRRCLRSLETSGIPERLRPGFWDNDGRCCGTAGAGAALLDAAQAGSSYAGEYLAFAAHLGDALVERAIVDKDGARWRFVEHRIEQPLLAPGTGWMQGAAGIAGFLLRLARVLDEGLDARVLDLPDQWWAVRSELTVTRAG